MTPCRILLVEDDADSAEAVALLLRVQGIDVEWAATAGEAIARYESDPTVHFDAILLDLMLPDMNGVALVSRLAKIAPLPPIVIHSAATQQRAVQDARIINATAILRKPVTWERMRRALEGCGAFPQVRSG